MTDRDYKLQAPTNRADAQAIDEMLAAEGKRFYWEISDEATGYVFECGTSAEEYVDYFANLAEGQS